MSNKIFDEVEMITPDTNQFDLTHDRKLSLNMGVLYPILVAETIPGDSMRITPQVFLKMAAMLFPIMHRVDVYCHFFWTPLRVLWRNWEKFIMSAPTDTPIVRPYITDTTVEPNTPLPVTVGSFFDHLGLPTATTIKEEIIIFPIHAYYRIFNEYYQDQNNDSNYVDWRDTLEALTRLDGLIDPNQILPLAVNYADLPLLSRAWEHDYFTSVAPTTQKGPTVTIPVTLNDLPVEVYSILRMSDDTPPTVDAALGNLGSGLVHQGGSVDAFMKMIGLAESSGASLDGSINQLRVSYALQRYYEHNMRTGTRYREGIRGIWGVNLRDNTIDRPQYVGGFKNNVVISEVLQTSSTNEDTALGDYAGHGVMLSEGNEFSFFADDHGILMGIMSVLPKTAYFQGISKMWTRKEPTDWYRPEFAHIGEQAVLNRELYYDPALTDNQDVFGYLPNGTELKTIPSSVHGQFRTTLLPWHLARTFANRPELNEDFIYVDPAETKRIFAVTDPEVDSLFAHVFFRIKANRKIPFFSTPM